MTAATGFLLGLSVLLNIRLLLWWLCQSNAESLRQEGRLDERYRLSQAAYWFSEDLPTYHLLTDLGKGMHVTDAREKWRREREAATAAGET